MSKRKKKTGIAENFLAVVRRNVIKVAGSYVSREEPECALALFQLFDNEQQRIAIIYCQKTFARAIKAYLYL